MPRHLSRISLVLALLLCSKVWALGLGEIRLQSALNEPLRAEIELLSATPEELNNLTIGLASSETFERYGLDRPAFLQAIRFQVIPSGRIDGNIIEVRSAAPITEPFLTFLVEAAWARGRLLREYTVLLDPPTFAPPAAAQAAPSVTAPTRSAPADSGRIQRAQPAPSTPPQARSQAAQTPPTSQPPAVVDDSPYDATTGGDIYVQPGDTLWGIAQRVRPDSRLTMNQTMLAIFEANPQAFSGNINLLRAGASLRVPSADQIYRISRGEAFSEVQRQNSAWGSGVAPTPGDTSQRPGLVLVPPDDDVVADGIGDDVGVAEPLTREEQIEQRLAELEAADVPVLPSLIEIRNDELATLREELAGLRGEVYEPPVEEPMTDDLADEPFVDEVFGDESLIEDGEIMVDDTAAVVDDAQDIEDTAPEPPPVVRPTRTAPEPTLVDQALSVLTNFWTILVAALVIVGGLLFWFMRRGRGPDDDAEAWRSLDEDDADVGAHDMTATETLRAPQRGDESFVVVEQGAGRQQPLDDTIDAPAADFGGDLDIDREETGEFASIEDTFSSETAVNLDQSDPVAEADFHMAYGLYDQAADLVNGALKLEPNREDLLTKLCEIYFVWGNRDAFVDAADRLKGVVGDPGSAEWDKIVIMGQQIAADHELFAGAAVAGATKAVDLSFEAGMDETGALDMEFIEEGGGQGDVFDVGAAEDETVAVEDGIDFDFGDDTAATAETRALPDIDSDRTSEMPNLDATAEMSTGESTVETPTIEEQFAGFGSQTSELPALDESATRAMDSSGKTGDETAEINLDDLDLDVSGLDETELASFDDLDATGETEALSETIFDEALSDTGLNEALDDLGEATGKNPEVDPNATGVQEMLRSDATGMNEALDIDSGLFGSETDTSIDQSLLDATGMTQVLSADHTVETASDIGAKLDDDDATLLAGDYGDDDAETIIPDDQETLLASLDDDDTQYDFAKTEALPPDVFTGNASLEETGELPAVASTDVDLDLDDLTAALQVSDAGDTIEQTRDDATVQQPRPGVGQDDASAETLSLGPDEIGDDLHEARTMTEVGTKLDLARAYVDMGDPSGARSILEEVLDEGDEGQRQQAQQLLDSLPS